MAQGSSRLFTSVESTSQLKPPGWECSSLRRDSAAGCGRRAGGKGLGARHGDLESSSGWPRHAASQRRKEGLASPDPDRPPLCRVTFVNKC